MDETVMLLYILFLEPVKFADKAEQASAKAISDLIRIMKRGTKNVQ